MEPCLPNLIVIGAMKCGTTSIHDYLNSHPEIQMSNEKELNYFIKGFGLEKGLEWYKSNFRGNSLYRGESSPGYSKLHIYPDVAERMNNLIPEAKLIYIIRNPIDRIISHAHEAISLGYRKPQFDFNHELMTDGNSNFILTGLYFKQLQEYLKYYSIDHVKVVVLEELMAKPLKTMNSVFNFLGLDALKDESLFVAKVNTSESKFSKTFAGRIVTHPYYFRSIKSLLNPKLKMIMKDSKIFHLLSKKPLKKMNLNSETYQMLRFIYMEDLNKLYQLYGGTIDGYSYKL